jgi:hypothetical protein
LVVDKNISRSSIHNQEIILLWRLLTFCRCIITSPGVEVGQTHLATERCGATEVVRYLAAIRSTLHKSHYYAQLKLLLGDKNWLHNAVAPQLQLKHRL